MVKALFREAVHALLARTGAEDEPPPRRGEKQGDRDSGMLRVARRFSRLLGLKSRTAPDEMQDAFREARAAATQPGETEDIFEAPGAYLSDPHDCDSPFYSDRDAFTEEFDLTVVTVNDYYYPEL